MECPSGAQADRCRARGRGAPRGGWTALLRWTAHFRCVALFRCVAPGGCMALGSAVVGCSDGSNVGTVEEAAALLSAVTQVAGVAAEPPPAQGEWASACTEGGRVSFRRDLRELSPKGATVEAAEVYRADVTVTLDECQEDGLFLTGVLVIQTDLRPDREWVKYWGDIAEGPGQEHYCRFDLETVLDQWGRGTVCGFPESEFDVGPVD